MAAPHFRIIGDRPDAAAGAAVRKEPIMVRHFRLHSLLCRLAVVAMAACAPLAAATAALAHHYTVGDTRVDHRWSPPPPPRAQLTRGSPVLDNSGPPPPRGP